MNSRATLKAKYVRSNQASFISKELRKAIMIRLKLRNKFSKDRTESNKKAYCKQTSCAKIKKQYYSNLEVTKVADNKKFKKIVKNFFSDKLNDFEIIALVDDNMVISDEQKIANIFIKYLIL